MTRTTEDDGGATPLAMAVHMRATMTNADAARDDFERLFHAQYGKVANIARRILFDSHAAEDVAQDVFVSFHRLHPPDAPFAAKWLHSAAAHAALNAMRGRKRRARREFADANAERAVPAVGDDPVETVASMERRAIVRDALGRIGAKYAMVLAMRYAGLSYAEIADALCVHTNQIGTLLRRAEAAFKKEFRHDPS